MKVVQIKYIEICAFHRVPLVNMQLLLHLVGFEVLIAVSMKVAVFWVVVSCSQV
jgi:hypothetical protein